MELQKLIIQKKKKVDKWSYKSWLFRRKKGGEMQLPRFFTVRLKLNLNLWRAGWAVYKEIEIEKDLLKKNLWKRLNEDRYVSLKNTA